MTSPPFTKSTTGARVSASAATTSVASGSPRLPSPGHMRWTKRSYASLRSSSYRRTVAVSRVMVGNNGSALLADAVLPQNLLDLLHIRHLDHVGGGKTDVEVLLQSQDQVQVPHRVPPLDGLGRRPLVDVPAIESEHSCDEILDGSHPGHSPATAIQAGLSSRSTPGSSSH